MRSLQESELSHFSQQEKNQRKAWSQKVLQKMPEAHPAQRGEGVGFLDLGFIN